MESTFKKYKDFRFQEISILLYRIVLAYIFFFIARILFIYFNNDILKIESINEIFRLCYYGLRFDTSAIVYVNSIFILLSILPFYKTSTRLYQKFLFYIYFLFNSIATSLNFIDFGYYRFNYNRIMANFFEVIKYENKTTLISHFIFSYFQYVLLYFFLITIWIYFYNKIKMNPLIIDNKIKYFVTSTLFFFGVVLLCIAGARGGDLKKSTRPITIIDSMNKINNPTHADVVLNTPFTIIRTLNQSDFKQRFKFDPKKIENKLKPIKKYESKVEDAPNIIIFILESMSREYWGSMNKNINNYLSFTPFLDSLSSHSLIFPNSFATSRKSIHGMPSVLAGIPSFEVAYTSSRYSKQKIESIVSIANKMNYETSFFHGAANGSMGLMGFSNTLGFDNYFGRDEYNNDSDFDGYWGIWDEPFLQFVKSKLDEKKQPFLGTIFTLTSHEPYIIPSKYENIFEKGEIDMHRCAKYTDYSLRKFFDKAKKSDWFENTIFIFTADHTNQSFYPNYKKIINRFATPIMIYKPNSNLKGIDYRLASHMDIYPSFAELIGYDKPFRSWGKSLFSEYSGDEYVINYFGGGSYFIMDEKYICVHNGEKAIGFYDSEDYDLSKNLIENKNEEMMNLEKKCGMFLQDYFNRIITGNM